MFSLSNRNSKPEITFTNPKPAWFWLKASTTHLFVVKLVYFRHHWGSDSCLASWLVLDQSMTKACVMTFM